MEMDDQIKKEIYAKSLLETVNRLIFQEVYKELKQGDQTYAKQPGLVAHPTTVMQMPDCHLDQLDSETFGKFMKEGYVIKDQLFESKVEAQLLGPVFKQMLLLEMEGKFQVRKVTSASVPLNRSDKFFNVDLTSLEGDAEFKTLKQLVRMLFFLPFEINKKVSLNLQVSESFQLSFMDHDHKFIKRRAESTFGE